MAHTHAYCGADGVIHFGPVVPAGALSFAEGIESDLHRAIFGSARLAYDGETWLVPGVPEAVDQNEGIAALIRHRDCLRASLARYAEDDRIDG